MIRVNLTGVFLTVKHALPHLLEAGGGSIVTIGSVASLVAAGQHSAYDASKGGVLQFTRAVAVEYVDKGIRANCVCPGLVATGLGANTRSITDQADVSGRAGRPAERLDVPMSRGRRPGRDRRRRRLPVLRRRLVRHRRRPACRRRLHRHLRGPRDQDRPPSRPRRRSATRSPPMLAAYYDAIDGTASRMRPPPSRRRPLRRAAARGGRDRTARRDGGAGGPAPALHASGARSHGATSSGCAWSRARTPCVEGVLVDGAGHPVGHVRRQCAASARTAARPLPRLLLCRRPADPIPIDVDAPTSCPADAAAVVHDYFADLDAGRFAAAAAHFSDDVLYSHPPYRHTGIDDPDRIEFRGRPALEAAFRARGRASFDHDVRHLDPARAALPLRGRREQPARRLERQLHLQPVAGRRRHDPAVCQLLLRAGGAGPVTDREAILDVIARYAQAVDDRDIEGIVGCFTPDGRIEFEGGQLTGEGHDGIRQAFETAFTRPALAPPAASTHLMANTLVTIEGDTARAETQAVAFLASGALGTVTTRGLRYSDGLRRDAGGWRIAHRVHRSLWQTEASGNVQNSS